MTKKYKQEPTEQLPTRMRTWEVTMALLVTMTIICLITVVTTLAVYLNRESRQNEGLRALEYNIVLNGQMHDKLRDDIKLIRMRINEFSWTLYGGNKTTQELAGQRAAEQRAGEVVEQ